MGRSAEGICLSCVWRSKRSWFVPIPVPVPAESIARWARYWEFLTPHVPISFFTLDNHPISVPFPSHHFCTPYKTHTKPYHVSIILPSKRDTNRTRTRQHSRLRTPPCLQRGPPECHPIILLHTPSTNLHALQQSIIGTHRRPQAARTATTCRTP